MILGLLLMASCFATDASAPRSPKMDGYDKAGPYRIELTLSHQERLELEARIRGFLWDHWAGRRRAYLQETAFSKEGEQSDSTYVVEPDQRGDWIIRVKIERRPAGGQAGAGEPVEYEAGTVERIEPRSDRLAGAVAIAAREKRQPGSYRLVLKDKAGQKTFAEL